MYVDERMIGFSFKMRRELSILMCRKQFVEGKVVIWSKIPEKVLRSRIENSGRCINLWTVGGISVLL